jgi:DNA repair photolyase
MPEELVKGRGAQYNSLNRFEKLQLVKEHPEGIDEEEVLKRETRFTKVFPKTILNKVESEDLFDAWSLNPYQGCEHGCIYCFARTTHEYLGYSAGLDFESKIMVKMNASTLLEKAISAPKYALKPIMLSGNTDCYQPIEKKLGITRRILEVLLKHRHPVSLITKNVLILRDLDILVEMAKLNLLHVNVSITTLDEDLRQKMEPRTATCKLKVELVNELSTHQIPVNVMLAPIIPSLNDHEIPEILKTVSKAGALSAAYSFVRLNGSIGEIFTDWIQKAFPDRAEKVLDQIREAHNGQLEDTRPGLRMRGEGKIAESIHALFSISKKKYFEGKSMPAFDMDIFKGKIDMQLSLF